MTANSESTANSSPDSTATKRTDETTRQTHLDRLVELEQWLQSLVTHGEKLHLQILRSCEKPESAKHSAQYLVTQRERAASVRWLIERESKRS